MNNTYTSQDRGGQQDYQQYLEAMDAVSIEKVASASAFFEPVTGNTLVDVGMASGTSSAILAQLFPKLSVIGVDINPKMVDIAQEKYRMANLSFRIDDGERLESFAENSVNGFFNCSSIHHITSYNNYDSNRAYNTIRRQTELLKERGIIVIRDFVKPDDREVILELSAHEKPGRPNDGDLLLEFARTARALSSPTEQGFPVNELKAIKHGTRRFKLSYHDAVEFIRRKDYYADWNVELQEEYGYFTQNQFEECFQSLGLRMILSTPIYNPWIINHRYRGQFALYGTDGAPLGFPPTNYLVAGEKITQGGKKIYPVRYLPLPERPFLRFSTYLHRDMQQVYDVVERPNEVVDLVPFFRDGNRVEILAKHAYPRPLVNAGTDSSTIDGKHYSGYITEGITAASSKDIVYILAERTGIEPEDVISIEDSLHYYTSPGGINEKVSSYLVQLGESPDESVVQPGNANFAESGSIRKYDAAQLLKTAQTGALAEARMELNIYNLFRKLAVPLPGWLGEKIKIAESAIPRETSVEELIATRNRCFEPVDRPLSFLTTRKAMFSESGIPGSKSILEYTYPSTVSHNTVLTLPVCTVGGELYAGLEIRDLPVPQLYTGSSTIAAVPARRLPKDVHNMQQLEDYIINLDIFGSHVTRFFRLGEKYFPSIGVTTEQVYPYVVQLDRSTDGLAWVRVRSLVENLELLEDGHLLISLSRLWHAVAGS